MQLIRGYNSHSIFLHSLKLNTRFIFFLSLSSPPPFLFNGNRFQFQLKFRRRFYFPNKLFSSYITVSCNAKKFFAQSRSSASNLHLRIMPEMFFKTSWTYRYDLDLWCVSKAWKKERKRKKKWIDKNGKRNSDKVPFKSSYYTWITRCARQINPLIPFHFARFGRCFFLCTPLCILLGTATWPDVFCICLA